MLTDRIFHRISRSEIQSSLAELGVRTGDSLFVSLSMRNLGWVVGGASAVVDALRDSVGSRGTLMMACTPSLDPLPSPPPGGVFSETETSSAAGRVSEAFRRRAETRRSLHPSGSMAAWGPRAAEWLDGHQDRPSPFGIDSPIDRLVSSGGRILIAGTHMGPILLYLQDRASFPLLYHSDPKEVRVEMRSGESRYVRTRLFRSASCQIVILQGERTETRDYVLMRDYALVFPQEREEALKRGGYLRHNHGRLVGRLQRLQARGVIRLGKIGRAPAALVEAPSFCEQVGADLQWEVTRFKEEYDPERLERLGLN